MTRRPTHSMSATCAVAAVLAALVLVGSYGRAWPQTLPCARWAELKADLAKRFHEVPVSSGIVNPQAVVQVLASPDGETWTVVVVNSNGNACVITAGKGWEPGINPEKKESRT